MSRLATIGALAAALLAGCSAMPSEAEMAQVRENQAQRRQAIDQGLKDRIDEHNRQFRARQAAEARACETKGTPAVGMHWQKVYETCWGKPQRVNTTMTASAQRDQLVYRQGYVYLTNGVVTAIQISR